MALKTGADRRHEPRIESMNFVSVAEFDEAGFLEDLSLGRTKDLSHDGLRLELRHPLPLRSRVSLKLALGEHVIDAHATVREVHEIDGERCSIGLRFEDLSADDYEFLHEYLELQRGD